MHGLPFGPLEPFRPPAETPRLDLYRWPGVDCLLADEHAAQYAVRC